MKQDAKMTDFELAYFHLSASALRHANIVSFEQWTLFKKESERPQWLYLYKFMVGASQSIIAWGTSTNSSDRIRKACLLNSKLTGKYDRRVDYLMLREIFGMPEIFVFEAMGKAVEVESNLKKIFGQRHCYRGLNGNNRDEISRNIVSRFRATEQFQSLSETEKIEFNRFLDAIYFAKRRHPKQASRTFFYGDCLEPGFLRTIDESSLEPIIEKALKVKF